MGLIHTSVGVVDYQPAGKCGRRGAEPARSAASDRVLPALSGGRCSHPPAQHVLCAERRSNAGLRAGNLVSASGFQNVVWGETRDFDGIFEWTPRASRPKMGVTLRANLPPRANFGIWCGQETIFVVNDNGGRCSTSRNLPGETWVTTEALTQIGVNNPPIGAGCRARPARLLHPSNRPTFWCLEFSRGRWASSDSPPRC